MMNRILLKAITVSAALLTTMFVFAANASGVDCASASGELIYSSNRSDGGAPQGPSSSLVLNNQTLIDVSGHGGAALHLANIQFQGKPIKVGQAKTSTDVEQTYAQKLSVMAAKDGKILFEDFVICKATTYMGPPRP